MDEPVFSERKMHGEKRIAQQISGRGLRFLQRNRPDRNGGPAARIKIQCISADPVAFIQPDLAEFIGSEAPDRCRISRSLRRIIVFYFVFGSLQGAFSLRNL